ncbi:MAG: HesA/MoeB/ThiF family protein [Thermoplasmata archaeon]
MLPAKFAHKYARQIILPQIGIEGQKKLASSKVLIIGCGADGTACLNLLARAGVGNITVIDRDVVEEVNLQRQSIYLEKDIGKPKAEVARRFALAANSSIKVKAIVDLFSASNALELVAGHDIVMDCTDNFRTRLLINDACVKTAKPWVYSGVLATYGMTASFLPRSPCFRCLFPGIDEKTEDRVCATEGILNTVPYIIIGMAVSSALRILVSNIPSPINDSDRDITGDNTKLIIYDAWYETFNIIQYARKTDCQCCVRKEFVFLEAEDVCKDSPDDLCIIPLCSGEYIVKLKKLNKDGFLKIRKNLIQANRLRNAGEKSPDVKSSTGVIIFREGELELRLFRSGNIVVKGAKNKEDVQALLEKYILVWR